MFSCLLAVALSDEQRVLEWAPASPCFLVFRTLVSERTHESCSVDALEVLGASDAFWCVRKSPVCLQWEVMILQ